MNNEYVLFDLDGTIVDTKEGITKCTAYALDYFGIKVNDLNDLVCFIGPPLHKSFQMFYGFDHEKSMKAVEKYRERYKDIGIFECSPYTGIEETIKEIFKTGRKIGLATSKPEEYAVRILEKFNLKKYFTVITGSLMDGSRTEKDEVITEALNRFHIENDKKSVIIIGDRSHDIIGGKKTGIMTLGVKYGFAKDGELEDAGADFIVDSPDKILDVIVHN